jgi:DNA/RNA endonuclease YhcR with UshA esterase domain
MFCTVASIAICQTKTITGREAAQHINEAVILEDTVKGYKVINDGFKLLDIGARYPNQVMTVVLKGGAIKDSPATLVGHRIHVEGTIELYRGKPEIIVTDKRKFVVQ